MHIKRKKLTTAAVLIFIAFVAASLYIAHLPNKEVDKGSPRFFAAYAFLVLAGIFFGTLRLLSIASVAKQSVLNDPQRARDLVLYILITFALLCAATYIWLRANHYVS